MKLNYLFKNLSILILFFAFIAYFSSCKENSTQPELNDEQFMQQVIAGGYSSNQNEEDNLMSQDISDMDDGGAVPDGGSGDTPLDSLIRWGRKITGVNLNYSLSWSGDTLVNFYVTRTVNGNVIIIGWQNGQQDSVTKPFTAVYYRTIFFKRVARTQFPRLNWRLYKVSMLNGGTTQPQSGTSQIEITKIEAYLNGSPTPTYTFLGPDFTQNIFTTRLFGGSGIPAVARNSQVVLKVYTTSQQQAIDYVAWHWARNIHGHYRIPFTLESQTGTGPYYRVYTKTFNIYPDHVTGVFNGIIGAATRESLFDDDVSKLAVTQAGVPYIVY